MFYWYFLGFVHFRNNFCHQKLLTDWPLASKLLGIQIDCTRMSIPSKMITIARRTYSILMILFSFSGKQFFLRENGFSVKSTCARTLHGKWERNGLTMSGTKMHQCASHCAEIYEFFCYTLFTWNQNWISKKTCKSKRCSFKPVQLAKIGFM